MAKFEALLEINQEQVENLANYVAYCKYYLKPKKREEFGFYLICRKDNKNIKSELKEELFQEYPFLKKKKKEIENKDEKTLKELCKYKSNETLKDFPFNWLKYEILGNNKEITFENDENIENIKQISGIYENPQNLQSYVNKLPKYSFAIWFTFRLNAPYFSKDDDEFYIIQNPILKETNFKVPMIRGSAWKGALAHAFRKLINDADWIEKRGKIESFFRIFGAGSENVKVIEEYLKDKLKKDENGNLEKYKKEFLKFVLFELGLEVSQELINQVNNAKNYKDISNILAKNIWRKYKRLQKLNCLPIEFQTHRGRAIIYPTYFDRLSLEIINPHDRKKRAGTNPIHYEVVPAGTDGIFQLVYIPFDGILKTDKALKDEVQKDLENITEALKKLAKKGIGAKTKLGWGRFEILESEKKICLDKNLELPEKLKNKGWERCQES